MLNDSIESLNLDISMAIRDIIVEIMDELNEELKDRIEEEVYNAYIGWWAESGYRTYEFLESFITDDVDFHNLGNLTEISEEIFHDPTLMTVHSGFPPIHVQRDRLAEIIESGDGYNMSDKVPPRLFWDAWISWCMVEIPKRFRRKCYSKGLYIVGSNILT